MEQGLGSVQPLLQHGQPSPDLEAGAQPAPPGQAAIGGSAAALPQSSPAAPPPSGAAADEARLGWWARLNRAVKKLKREVLALHYAIQDPRVGLLPRLLAFLAIAYALSPLDLIPDFIPVLGLLDDLIILPGLLLLAMWLIPADVMAAGRQRAEDEPLRLSKNWGMCLVVFAMWDAMLLGLAWWGCGRFASDHPLQQYKVWIVAACGVLIVAGELIWAVAQWRKDAKYRQALQAAGAAGDLQEALLSGGSAEVHQHLEP